MCAGASLAKAEATPVLAAAVIDGSTAYDASQLYGVYREQLGRPIDRAHARDIALALETLYERDGFSRPEVQLHGDLARDGILRVQVFEPRITRVAIHGDTGPHGARLSALADKLHAAVPLRPALMQDTLQQMRALPGLEISASTRRDVELRNAYVLDVNAKYTRVGGNVRLSNRGTDEVGPVFVSTQVTGNDLLGLREHVGALLITGTDPTEYRGAALYADAPLGSHGMQLSVLGFRSASQPHELPTDLPDDYRRTKANVRLAQALTRDLQISVMLEGDDLNITREGALLRDDRLRVLEFGTQLGWGSSDTRYLASVELRHGLRGLGAQLDARDLAIDPRRGDFLLTRAQLIRVQRFAAVWSVRLDALAQHSGYVLPYSERFKIGGERLGRGFEVTEIAGDLGAGAKLELRRDLPWSAMGFGKPSLYGFSDYGVSWKQDAPGTEKASTGGIGIALDGRRIHSYLELARPITELDAVGTNGTTLFAELSVNF